MSLAMLLAIGLVIALGLLVVHVVINEEDGRKIDLLELQNRDLSRRNAELELKSEMDERLILTLAKDLAGTAAAPTAAELGAGVPIRSFRQVGIVR